MDFSRDRICGRSHRFEGKDLEFSVRSGKLMVTHLIEFSTRKHLQSQIWNLGPGSGLEK